MHRSIVAPALVLSLVPGLAHAAEPPCLTSGEFASLAGYALPSVISGTVQRCSASLPADAFLKREGGGLANRYAEAKAASWPEAKAAFLKLSTNTNDAASALIRTLPDPTLRAMLDGLIEGMVGQNLPETRCSMIDHLVRLLAPLPPENTAQLIALAAGLGAKSGKARIGSFSICAA